jgi:hypothetical protein
LLDRLRWTEVDAPARSDETVRRSGDGAFARPAAVIRRIIAYRRDRECCSGIDVISARCRAIIGTDGVISDVPPPLEARQTYGCK